MPELPAEHVSHSSIHTHVLVGVLDAVKEDIGFDEMRLINSVGNLL